jgi:oligopeptidase B
MNRQHFARILAGPLVAVLLAPAVLAQNSGVATRPPVAKKAPHVTTVHGDTLKDDYFWLREKSNPEVISYLEAENAYTEEVMKPTKALQETLYSEMLGRIKQTDLSVPPGLGTITTIRAPRKANSIPTGAAVKGA